MSSSGSGKPLQLTAGLGAGMWGRAELVRGCEVGPVIDSSRVGKHRRQGVDDSWPERVLAHCVQHCHRLAASLLSTGGSSLPYCVEKSSLGYLRILCSDGISKTGKDLSFHCFAGQTGAQRHSVICMGSLGMCVGGLELRPDHVLSV